MICDSISPNGSKCTKEKGHTSDHHDHEEGTFGIFEIWHNKDKGIDAKKTMKLKCKNCKHGVWFDDSEEVWRHKAMLHNDNCECRNPVPNFEPLQKAIVKDVKEAMKDYKPPPYDRSRGWDSIPLEEKLRSFTI